MSAYQEELKQVGRTSHSLSDYYNPGAWPTLGEKGVLIRYSLAASRKNYQLGGLAVVKWQSAFERHVEMS